jgi:hypothetical protein
MVHTAMTLSFILTSWGTSTKIASAQKGTLHPHKFDDLDQRWTSMTASHQVAGGPGGGTIADRARICCSQAAVKQAQA